jgi:hypothetical protein
VIYCEKGNRIFLTTIASFLLVLELVLHVSNKPSQKEFHYLDCPSVNQMKNKEFYGGAREKTSQRNIVLAETASHNNLSRSKKNGLNYLTECLLNHTYILNSWTICAII